MFLIFDTETTGLPRSFKAPISEVDNWPRVVQFAWEAFGVCGRGKLSRSELIRPDGFTIPRDAEKVHGISTELAQRKGVPIATALNAFLSPLAGATLLIAHNFSFDARVLGAECHRLGIADPFRQKSRLCTMLETTAYCALRNRYGYKWPTLGELHRRLFDDEPREAHDAAADVATCAKCFFELRRLGVIAAPKLDRATCATCLAALDELDVRCTRTPAVER